mmetsp:Transcript_67271/g.111849  ORF Transcript_67271/g.111849 Transcript_67271/m.111849 type:complete len:229 (-) Transcript_67271:823-1509(-)
MVPLTSSTPHRLVEEHRNTVALVVSITPCGLGIGLVRIGWLGLCSPHLCDQLFLIHTAHHIRLSCHLWPLCLLRLLSLLHLLLLPCQFCPFLHYPPCLGHFSRVLCRFHPDHIIHLLRLFYRPRLLFFGLTYQLAINETLMTACCPLLLLFTSLLIRCASVDQDSFARRLCFCCCHHLRYHMRLFCYPCICQLYLCLTFRLHLLRLHRLHCHLCSLCLLGLLGLLRLW